MSQTFCCKLHAAEWLPRATAASEHCILLVAAPQSLLLQSLTWAEVHAVASGDGDCVPQPLSHLELQDMLRTDYCASVSRAGVDQGLRVETEGSLSRGLTYMFYHQSNLQDFGRENNRSPFAERRGCWRGSDEVPCPRRIADVPQEQHQNGTKKIRNCAT